MKAAFFEITEEWQKQILSQALSEHKISFINTSLDESAQAPKDAEILGVFINSRITKGVMDKMPNLKLIVTLSTGFDHIDVNEAKKRGISVCNVPSYGENTVAEFTMALILTLSRRIYPAIKRVHEEGKFSYEGLRGFDLKGKKIGVVGTGKIGARLIKIAQGFEMEILAYDPHPREDLEVSYLPLNDLLSQADVVTIHVPYMPDTHHLLNINNLKLIKPSAILINTSRGGLVDTMALLTALKNGQLAGAALDVLEEEGYIVDELNLLSGHPNEQQLKTILANHELMQMDNVIVTPHNAFNTKEALERIINTSIDNIKAFISGTPQNTVVK